MLVSMKPEQAWDHLGNSS